EVAFIMQLGGLLEDLTVSKARAGIEKLVKLTPQTARIISEKGDTVVPAEKVKIGDIIRVLPGETIAVDGVIISGKTSIDESVMTGESLPVDKTEGDEVSSGTVNQFGAFDMRATKVGEDSSIQRMIRLVESADAGKAKIVGLADRWATWIVIIALSAAAITWIVSGEIIRAVTILVVFCPCSLVLATPTAIMAAIGNSTKHGFLVREGDALERLAKVGKIAFDKTGTLTYGKPDVVNVVASDEKNRNKVFDLAASAELMSEHPLGKAVVSAYKKSGGEIKKPNSFDMVIGKGVKAEIDGNTVFAGSINLLKENGIEPNESIIAQTQKYLQDGCTVIYVAENKALLGFIVLSDTVRPDSKNTISNLYATAVTPVLLTGDNERAAGAIARNLGIKEYRASCFPEDKLEEIGKLQTKGESVCMIGDGINDAPALKKADVGIAMGAVGSDIAVDAADIALVNDDIKELPHLVMLSKRMMTTIKINLSFSMILNFVAIILAITGVLGPVV
ncbi:MAG: cation-translocating P-type ATPase, partial [Clostridia bacterium]|nr:cation-translocating P-type ATPase [Clostridia bacterium]